MQLSSISYVSCTGLETLPKLDLHILQKHTLEIDYFDFKIHIYFCDFRCILNDI